MTEVLRNSCFLRDDKEFFEKSISNLITPVCKYQENIKSRNNAILGFHQFI